MDMHVRGCLLSDRQVQKEGSKGESNSSANFENNNPVCEFKNFKNYDIKYCVSL